ncbi:MAG: membrane integrity-associated transporter subunit PqiC [Microbacteriaceae bacterium]|nr:membrane integrity-associated transporter subunit PqiC [Burkholderiaceae bacterium]
MPTHHPWPPGLPVHAATVVPGRRAALLAALTSLTGGLSACGTPLPAISWLRLPADGADPIDPIEASAQRPGSASPVWQLMAPVSLPGHLHRDALLVPQGAAGLQPLGGARWAEPLRDAVPRLLRTDLSRTLGTPVWTAPLPPGVTPTRQLRVDFGALDVTPDGRGVSLQARWSVADPSGATAPRVADAAFVTNAGGADAQALAVAHRQALQQLARRIAVWLAAGTV